jgi:lysophospholipase L1-like esterase
MTQPAHPVPTTLNPTPASERSYLALGDSYTIGESVPESERWSVQLAALLRQEGIPLNKPDIIARTGWTTAELAEAIRDSGNRKTYSMVSLLIGVNNQYRGQSAEIYRTEFTDLLKTATSFAGGNPEKVFVLSIPDWGVTPFAAGRDRQKIAEEIDAFNAIAREECRKLGIAYVDITLLSRRAADDLSLVASDQLHCSGKMYRQWAAQALPVVKNLLK